jgi:PhnB protein
MAVQLVPSLVVGNGLKALDFYQAAFGAVEVSRALKSGTDKVMHAELKFGDFKFFVSDDFPEMCGGQSRSPKALGGTPVTLFITAEDCDAVVKRAEQAGANVIMPPMDMFWGDRFAKVVDPFGHEWGITSPISEERKKAAFEAQKAWL